MTFNLSTVIAGDFFADLASGNFELNDYKGTGISVFPIRGESISSNLQTIPSETNVPGSFALNRSISLLQRPEAVFWCDCGRRYSNKGTLLRHKRYECQRERQFQCDYCLKRFFRKGHLVDHITYVHFGGKKNMLKL